MGFDWVDPDPPEDAADQRPNARVRVEIEGVRGVNYILVHPDEYRKSKQLDTRLTLDAKRSKQKTERKEDDFYYKCAMAVISQDPDPDIDNLAFKSMHFDGLDPSIPPGMPRHRGCGAPTCLTTLSLTDMPFLNPLYRWVLPWSINRCGCPALAKDIQSDCGCSQ